MTVSVVEDSGRTCFALLRGVFAPLSTGAMVSDRIVGVQSAMANPASRPGSVSQTAGTLTAGTVPDGACHNGAAVLSNQDQTTVHAQQAGHLSLDRSATPAIYGAVGDIIFYGYFRHLLLDEDRSSAARLGHSWTVPRHVRLGTKAYRTTPPACMPRWG